jgi:hypothetical protein
MNKMVRIQTPELDELDAIERAQNSLARFIADYEARTGKPFRDPEPTPEQVGQARRRADNAMRGLIGLLPLTEDEKRFVGRVK